MTWRDDSRDADHLDDRDDPEESDMDDSDEPELVNCPHCRKYISEDAERCHHCGQYILPEHSAKRLTLWVIVGLVLAGIAMLAWVT